VPIWGGLPAQKTGNRRQWIAVSALFMLIGAAAVALVWVRRIHVCSIGHRWLQTSPVGVDPLTIFTRVFLWAGLVRHVALGVLLNHVCPRKRLSLQSGRLQRISNNRLLAPIGVSRFAV